MLLNVLSFKLVTCANEVSAQISEGTVAFAIFPPDIMQEPTQESLAK